jgi:uncharacterized integral membrane protein (TIGR00698 family)
LYQYLSLNNEHMSTNSESPVISLTPESDPESKENLIAPLPQKGWSEDTWAVIIGSSIIVLTILLFATGIVSKFKNPVYKWTAISDLTNDVLNVENLTVILFTGLAFALISSIAIKLTGGKPGYYLAGFGIIYILAIISLIIAGNKSVNANGIEYVIFALIAGLVLGNVFKLPAIIREAARSEFFIKTGLVILGTSVLFSDVVKAGIPGILQALAVVAVVWFFALWLSRKLKVDDEFGVILASAVSICGVSAAIVASGAIQGDKKKLSYVTSLVLLVAIPMLILQPFLIRYFNIPEIVGGAWLGGTLDTTASVTAAAQLVGPVATKAGVIIKFSQNVLIGVAAFFIAAWWVLKKNDTGKNGSVEKPGLGVIWERFPKFVLGFIAASLLFSFFIPAETIRQTSGFLNSLRTVWFALAFVAIGLEANFSSLVSMQGGRPALAFIGAQFFNLVWTLLLAYLLFGGYIFPVPDLK